MQIIDINVFTLPGFHYIDPYNIRLLNLNLNLDFLSFTPLSAAVAFAVRCQDDIFIFPRLVSENKTYRPIFRQLNQVDYLILVFKRNSITI